MEKIKVTIQSIQKKQIETKFGTKDLYTIKGGDGRTYSSYVGKWNSGWSVGEIVEAEYNSVTKGDNTYHQLRAPAEFKQSFGGGGGGGMSSPEVLQLLKEIKDELAAIKLAVQKDAVSKSTNDLPNYNDPASDIHF